MWVSETSKISIYNARVLSIRHLRFCLFLGIHQEEQIFHRWCSSEISPWKRCFLLKTHHGFRFQLLNLTGVRRWWFRNPALLYTWHVKKKHHVNNGFSTTKTSTGCSISSINSITTPQVSRHPFAGTVRTADCHFTPGPVLWQPCQRPRKTARHLRMLGQFLKLYMVKWTCINLQPNMNIWYIWLYTNIVEYSLQKNNNNLWSISTCAYVYILNQHIMSRW